MRGLRPVVALRFFTENVPKPINLTSSPFFKDVVIAANVAFNASSAFAFERSGDLFANDGHRRPLFASVMTLRVGGLPSTNDSRREAAVVVALAGNEYHAKMTNL